MWLSRLGRRRGSLAHLAESAHCLASGPAQVEAGGRSLALHETAAPCNAAGRVNAALVLRQLSSLAAPHSSASSGGSASSSSAGSSSGRGRGSSGSSKHSPSSWQLMARVKQAETCQQVLQLVQQAGQQCDTSHFATAANRMAKLHRQQRADRASHCQAFSQLLQFAAEQRLELRAVAVCQAGYAAGVLRYRFPPAQQAAWQERLACSLADADPQSVANALWGWSKLRARLSRELAAATDAAVQRTAAAMKPQEVSNTLWAFANGSWQLSNDASAALRQRLEAVLPKTNAQEVANSLWALAKLGLPLEGADAAAVDAAVQRTAAAMKPQEVSNTLWAFANGGWQLSNDASAVLMQRLEVVLPKANAQEVANSLWALAKLRLPLEGADAAAVDAAVQRTAAAMNPQEVSNTLWAFANGGWQLSSSAAAALMLQLEAVLPDASSQAVANSLWAMAKLGLPLEGADAAAVDAAVQRTAAAMGPQNVANTLWAFANGGWQLSNDASAALRQRLEAVLPKANAQEVANSLWALAKLGLPLEGADAAAVDAAVQRTAAAMGPQEVSNTLWAFATGGWQLSSSAAAALMLQLEAVLPDASSQAVANSLWALATLTVTHGNRFATVPAPLLDAVVAWADAHWHQLPATWVCDLCYNLARLGVQPDRAWIDAAVARCVAGISARESENGWFANLIWACSKWQHSLDAAALAPLVAGAVSSVSADWQRKGRRGGLRLLRSLAQQPGGFSMASAPASAAEALQQRLLPLVCGDIDLVASLEAEGGELDYLADCAASCAAVGLHLPPAQLEAICRYVQDNPQQLDDGVRAHLQRAFEAWGHQPGRALLAQLSVAV